MKFRDYNSIPWNEIVCYDETSSTFLRRLTDCQRAPTRNKRFCGDEAGCLNFDKNKLPKYATIKYKSNSYLIHRVVYILNKGAIPDDMVINHVDFNTHNNNISNLELCTFRENLNRTQVSKGLKLHHRNTSGVSRVSESVKFNGYKTYLYACAQCCDGLGNSYSKLFPYAKYGKELSWKMAVEYVESIRGFQ